MDGLTPRLILELASGVERDVRVGIRDAVYLYEVQVRRGRLCSATRSSADGSFERGDFVLPALLGVSAGRFVVEPDASPCRVDFEGTPPQILRAPIERARAALSSISAAALVGVTRVHVAAVPIAGYLACTPEPARQLLEKIMAGASPRELIMTGAVSPRLLEAVLSDIARRGAITHVDRVGSEPLPRSEPSLPEPSLPEPSLVASASVAAPKLAPMRSSPKADDVTAEDAGWFSLKLESSRPPPAVPAAHERPSVAAPPPAVANKPNGLPFSSEVTPSADRLWEKITDGVFSDPIGVSRTIQGVGMPEVKPTPIVPVAPAPSSPSASAEELDALASALTEPSPSPEPVAAPELAAVAAVEPTPAPARPAIEQPLAVAAPTEELPPPSFKATLASRVDSKAPSAAAARVSALKTPRSPAPGGPAPSANAGLLFRFVAIAAVAFAVAYIIVSYYRMQGATDPRAQPRLPAPATS